jgi:hypothetical protein
MTVLPDREFSVHSFSLSTLNTSPVCLLASELSDEKLADDLTEDPL